MVEVKYEYIINLCMILSYNICTHKKAGTKTVKIIIAVIASIGW